MSFNGTVATVFTSWSGTSITAIVPAGATTGPVVVTVQGIATSGPSFTVVGAKVVAGDFHTGVLKPDGTSWAWGTNNSGQVGDGTTIARVQPVLVTTLSAVTAIGKGASHSLAAKSDGTLWAWGNNGNGQLGDGTTTQRTAPGTDHGAHGHRRPRGGHVTFRGAQVRRHGLDLGTQFQRPAW